jgi:hypothetical protein
MKKVKMNNDKVLNIVKETLERDGVFVCESKIDTVIKKYLMEREEMLLDNEDSVEDMYEFTSETLDTFKDMALGLHDTVGDLEMIQTTEGDVLIETDRYADEYIGEIVEDLQKVIDRLEFLREMGSNPE